MKYKIGYVDEDKMQIKQYTRELRPYFDVVSYDITKGMKLPALIDQVYLSDVDLLLVDYLMVNKGVLTFNGDKVVEEYEKIKPRFPAIVFTNEAKQAFDHVDNPNIIYTKGEVKKNLSHFVKKLKKSIGVYQKYIKERKDIIKELNTIGDKKGLNPKQKNQLLTAQLELNGLDKRSMELPLQLLSEEKIETLSQTTKEAQDFLESLIKKRNKA